MSLNSRISHFYDRSTPIWLDTWGEHMHHGYYGADGKTPKDKFQAQIDLVEELLKLGNVTQARHLLDAGCGVGGSARYLAQRFGASALGLTLSAVQAREAEAYTQKAGLSEQVRFQVRDMMTLLPSDGPFDLVWSMESAEHIADKQRLFDMFYQLLSPGGTLLMATWCHRPMPPELNVREQALLQKIYDLYHLPPMVPRQALEEMATRAGFTQLRSEDWSQSVSPFWGEVIRSALTLRSLQGLLRAGLPTLKGAWAMRYMNQGYRRGLIEFAVLAAKKS
ncbi:MAG: methyltransferase domain-containing protein [Bacteroidetes bacterium]|nr:MAG: methyltransferase domain-containing protein [Bacteroidota bacterium]